MVARRAIDTGEHNLGASLEVQPEFYPDFASMFFRESLRSIAGAIPGNGDNLHDDTGSSGSDDRGHAVVP
jgi:hypothetical protein